MRYYIQQDPLTLEWNVYDRKNTLEGQTPLKVSVLSSKIMDRFLAALVIFLSEE